MRLERLGADEFKGRGNGRAEMCLRRSPMTFSESVQQSSQGVNLLAERLLPFAGRFEFLFDGLPMFGGSRSAASISRSKLIDGVSADAALQRFGQPGIDDMGEAAEFPLDGLGFAYQDSKNAVFGPLPVDEVMAEDIVMRLKFAVDAAVPLFHAAGIPRDIEVKQIPAVGLKVETFTSGVSRNEDADGMLARFGVEGQLDRLAFLAGSGAVKDRDPVVGAVGAFNCGLKLLMQVTLRVIVLGEDDDSNLVPLGWSLALLARLGKIGTLVLANPLDKPH